MLLRCTGVFFSASGRLDFTYHDTVPPFHAEALAADAVLLPDGVLFVYCMGVGVFSRRVGHGKGWLFLVTLVLCIALVGLIV